MAHHSQAWTAAVCLALVCLTPWSSSLPLAAYQSPGAPGYPAGFYQPQYLGVQGQQLSPYLYMPAPAAKSAKGVTQQYGGAVGNLQGFPNNGYFYAPYPAPGGVYPVPQYRTSPLVGTPVGQLPGGGQYLVYPAGTEPYRGERQNLWQNVQNFLQGLRPGSNRPNPLNPLNWFGNPQNNATGEGVGEAPGEEPSDTHESAEPGGHQESPQGVQGPTGSQQPLVSNQLAEQQFPPMGANPENEEEEEEPASPMVTDDVDSPVEVIQEAEVDEGPEEAGSEVAEVTSRLLGRSSYFPVVGIPRNIPRRRMGTTEGGGAAAGGGGGAAGGGGGAAGGGGGAAPGGEDEVGEQEEEEEEDSVVIGPGGTNPSVAQAKPAAIALAGVGGVAAAAPTATAVVGANGLAVAAPSATAIAGPSAGAPPPGLLPKFPTRRVPAQKVSAEEARRNAAMIEAARRQANILASGLGNLRSSSYPGLPLMAYQAWRGDNFGSN